VTDRRLITIVVLLGLLLGACTTSAGPDPGATPAPPAATPAITLRMWHGWSGAPRDALARLVDRYNQGRQNGRVLLEERPLASLPGDLRAATQAGVGPHLVLVPSSWLGTLATSDLLLDLDEAIPAETQRATLPAALASARAAGAGGQQRLYGMPLSFDTLALFYNRANLSEAPEDTDLLISLAHGLSAPDATPPRWGLAVNLSLDNMLGYLYAFDGRVFDDTGAPALGGAGRAGTERWLAWLAQLRADPELFIRPDSGIQVDRALKNNSVLITFAWAHQLPDMRRLWGEKMGIAPLPLLSQTGRAPEPLLQSQVVAVSKRAAAAERNAAVEFLRYIASDEAQRELLRVDVQPASAALKLAGDDPQTAAARVFREQAGRARPMLNGANRDAIWQTLLLMQRQVLFEQASPSDAVTAADERLRAILGK
jgi:maltose-binding protein MalE